jgi:hypothetical protein
MSGFACLPMAAQLRAMVTQAVVRCRPDNTLYAVVFSENLIVTFLEKKAIPLEVDDMLLRKSQSKLCIHPSAVGTRDVSMCLRPLRCGHCLWQC